MVEKSRHIKTVFFSQYASTSFLHEIVEIIYKNTEHENNTGDPYSM